MSIKASHCSVCGRNVIPPRDTCPFCPSSDKKTEIILMRPTGTVMSHTTLEMPPEGFEPPVFLALVKLDDGVLALCHVVPEVIDSIKVGCRVVVGYDSSERLIVTGVE